jgi:dCTP diphosphatase
MSNTLDLPHITEKLRQFANERDWNQFHSPKNLAMAISVEASELLEIFQWLTEAQSRTPNAQQQEQIRHEMADVMLYLIRLSDVLGIDMASAITEKMAINAARYPADKVKGSAKKYTEY